MDCWRGPVIDDEDALGELLDRAVLHHRCARRS
jgi:hypothetical protein